MPLLDFLKSKVEPLFVQKGTGGDLLTDYAKQRLQEQNSNVPASQVITPRAPSTMAFFPKAYNETLEKVLGSVPDTSTQEGRIQFAQNSISPLPMLNLEKAGVNVAKAVAPSVFGGFKGLTTKFLDYAKGKTTLSRQEILDFAKRPELKKGEADLLNRLGSEVKDTKIPAQEFADSIRRDLLELKPVKVHNPQYTGTTIDKTRQLGSEMYGKNAKGGFNYEEVVFESPITTNGSSHYPNSKNYFAHARGDEVVESGKKIWREQEIQSDALQKEGLERMKPSYHYVEDYLPSDKKNELVKIKSRAGDIRGAANKNEYKDELADLEKREEQILEEAEVFKTKKLAESEKKVEQLQPFTNDRFGERIMRERIKAKAQAGYEKYRLPTGETIGKIEGFTMRNWGSQELKARLTPENIRVGLEVQQIPDAQNYTPDVMNKWIVTDILGETGRFKAIPKGTLVEGMTKKFPEISLSEIENFIKTCL